MPAVRGERGSRLAGEPRAMISHGDDCGLLCAACALGVGGDGRSTRPTMEFFRCRDRVLAVLVPAAGCLMPGRGRADSRAWGDGSASCDRGDEGNKWQHAVLLRQAAVLSCWRQANRLRVRDTVFLFAPGGCYRAASHKPGPGRHTHDVQAHACSSRACHMSETSRALGSKRAAGWQDVGGSGAMRMQLNVCRRESKESCLELELADGEDAIYLPPIP
jgi:hypothetical protein